MSDVQSVEVHEKIVYFRTVPDGARMGCAQCMADKDFQLCAALPDNCGTEGLHYEGVN